MNSGLCSEVTSGCFREDQNLPDLTSYLKLALCPLFLGLSAFQVILFSGTSHDAVVKDLCVSEVLH